MLYTKKQFGALTGFSTRHLSTYVKRRQLEFNAMEMINSENDINAIFMEKHTKGVAKQDNLLKLKSKKENTDFSEFDDGWSETTSFIPGSRSDKLRQPQPWDWAEPPEEEPDFDENGIPKISTSDRAFKHWQAEKYRLEGQIKELEFQKKMGDLIPVDLVKGVVLQQSKSFTSSFRQALSRMVDLLVIKYKLTGVDAAELRKGVVETVNKSITDSLDVSKKEIIAIVKEFSAKKKIDLEN